jgi:MFS family permease
VGRTFASLGSRNFRLFFLGQLISNSGNWLTTVALTLLVLHRTGSGTAVGLLAVCQYGPMLVLAPWAGLIADRSDKRRLLYLTQGLEMAESFVLAGLAVLPHPPLPAVFGTAFVGGCLLAFDNPARRSFVNEMVPAADVPNAVTLYSGMVALSRVLGPTIAGALIVAVGYGWCFTIDGLSYLVVLAALVAMRRAELRPAPAAVRGPGQVREGVRYVARTRSLRVSFLMLLVIGVASYNFTVVLPLYVERGLGGSDRQFTWVYAAFSLGAVLATLLVARRTAVGLRVIVLGAAAFGAAMLAMALMPDLPLAYPVAALVGGTSVTYVTATTAFAQLRARRNMIGRVLALQTVLQIGTTPIGGPLLGYLADVAGGRAPVLVGAVAALAAAGYGAVALRGEPGPDPDRDAAPGPGEPVDGS